VIKPTRAGKSKDEYKVWCANGLSKGHYQGVCRDGILYSPERWDNVMNFDCGKEVVQAVGGTGTTTCGYWGRGCTDGSTDFAAGTAAAGGAGPLTGGKFPAYEPSVRSGITSPAPFRDWNGPVAATPVAAEEADAVADAAELDAKDIFIDYHNG
jgi:hypothetical protein